MDASGWYTMLPQQDFQGNGYNSWQPYNNDIGKPVFASNWAYRRHLQSNAKDIMKRNTMSYIEDSGNNPYPLMTGERTNVCPILFTSLHDNQQPYDTSDLKTAYLAKEQIKARMIAPSILPNKR